MIVVSNSGPLISLARVWQFELLRELFTEIFIPQAVWREVVERGSGLPAAAEILGAPWVRTQEVRDRVAVDLLEERMGPGESEAVVLTLEMGATILLMDEARGRRGPNRRGAPSREPLVSC